MLGVSALCGTLVVLGRDARRKQKEVPGVADTGAHVAAAAQSLESEPTGEPCRTTPERVLSSILT
jgi:hypothetical protein